MRRGVLAVLVGIAMVVSGIGVQAGHGDGHEDERTVETEDGSRRYLVWTPAGYTGETARPLVLMLHGCNESAEDFRDLSRMNAVADDQGFIVVYPDQTREAQGGKCWRWFNASHQQRGQGEPLILAEIVREVTADYNVDSDRRYVAGLSAGAAMSAVMGAAYPDLFSAIAVHSGLEYGAADDVNEGMLALYTAGPDPDKAGRWAYQEMQRSTPQRMPTMVVHGDADVIVVEENGHQVADQWLQTNDLVDDGTDDDSVDATPDDRFLDVGTRKPTTVSCYHDAAGDVVVEKWIVHGMSHTWAGGHPEGVFADPVAPDASSAIWAFFETGSAKCGVRAVD